MFVFKLVSNHTRKSQSEGPNQDSGIAELALGRHVKEVLFMHVLRVLYLFSGLLLDLAPCMTEIS